MSPRWSDRQAGRAAARRTRLHLTPLEARETPAVVTVASDTGPGSLRDAVAAAAVDGLPVTFDPVLAGQTISLTTALFIANTQPVVITGLGADATAIDGPDNDQAFIVDVGASFTLTGVEVRDTAAPAGEFGGAISISPGASVELNASRFFNNFSDTGGGAVFNNDATLTVTACAFTQNQSGGDGGAIFNNGTLTVSDSSFTGNTATAGSGGAISSAAAATLDITNTDFDSNTADRGGAVRIEAGTVPATVNGSLFTANSAAGFSGGGAISAAGPLTLQRSTLSGNSAVVGVGGAIDAAAALSVFQSTLSDNAAGGSGGAVNVLTGGTDVSAFVNTTIDGNTSGGSGGGVNHAGGELTLFSSTVTENTAVQGGGVSGASSGLALFNTVVALNASAGGLASDTVGTFDPLSADNFIGFDASAQFDQTLNIVGTATALDPLLAPLADNGGPTLTRLPLPGSPLIDAVADLLGVDVDQRDVARPQGPLGDIGAVEAPFTPPVTLPPVAATDNVSTFADSPVTLDPRDNDADPEGQTLLITAVSQGGNGSVTIDLGSSVTYTPDPGFVGNDFFTYTVNDGQGGISTGTVFVRVLANNAPPVARDDMFQFSLTDAGSATLDVLRNDSDPDGDDLTITPVTQPAFGLVTTSGGASRLTYSLSLPNLEGSLADTFTYTVSDANGQTSKATVSVTIVGPPPVPDLPVSDLPPQPVDDDFATTLGTPIIVNVLANDLDPEGGILTFTALGQGNNGTTVLNDDGTITYTPNVGFTGSDAFAYTVSDGVNETTATAFITVGALPPARQFAVGAGVGGGSNVTLFGPDGGALRNFTGPDSPGGVRTAAADVNGDGVADVFVGAGPGAFSVVQLFDGATGTLLFTQQVFEDSFTGGVFVAAGDIDGDGLAELIVTPDEGGGPVVVVLQGVNGVELFRFFGIEDPDFRGGARAGVGDVTGDGVGDIVVSAGFQGGPRVAVFDGLSVAARAPQKPFGDFFAFEDTVRNGAFVSAGDVNGDGFADIVAGAGPGGGPRVTVFDAASLLSGTLVETSMFFAGDVENRGGVRVAVKDLDGDQFADVLTAAGETASPVLTRYQGASLAVGGANAIASEVVFDETFGGGVFVG